VSEIPEIEADIERTRADLAATVDQLASRAEQAKSDTLHGAAYVGAAAAAVLVVYLVVKKVRARS